jgi:hypothetical protein
VLLVGDADVMPVRFFVFDRNVPPSFNYGFCPTDLYYADLAKADGLFDDWNAHKGDFHVHAGYFGEVRGEHNKSDAINYDGIDMLPDVAVGRWPVSTPEQMLTSVVSTLAPSADHQAGGAATRPAQPRRVMATDQLIAWAGTSSQLIPNNDAARRHGHCRGRTLAASVRPAAKRELMQYRGVGRCGPEVISLFWG